MGDVLHKDEAISENQENEAPITTYEAFRSFWYMLNPKGRQSTFDKIGNLKDALNGGDPISFLYVHYFDQRKSLDEILSLDVFSGIKFISRATLARLLFGKGSLNWKARPNTERTPVHQEKLDAQTLARIKQFEDKVSQLIGKASERIFSMGELKTKTYRIQKALYILSSLGRIEKDILFRLAIEGGLDSATISLALNKKLQDVLNEFPNLGINFDEIKLYPQSIDRWVKYQKDKQNLEVREVA